MSCECRGGTEYEHPLPCPGEVVGIDGGSDLFLCRDCIEDCENLSSEVPDSPGSSGRSCEGVPFQSTRRKVRRAKGTMTRYTIIYINRDPTGLEELLAIEVTQSPYDTVKEVLWGVAGWLDGIEDKPVGEIVQMPEGYWTFHGEAQLRMYVQVG